MGLKNGALSEAYGKDPILVQERILKVIDIHSDLLCPHKSILTITILSLKNDGLLSNMLTETGLQEILLNDSLLISTSKQ